MGITSPRINLRGRSLALAAALAFLLAAPHAVRAQAVFMPSRVPPAPLGGGRVTGRITAIVGATMQLALRNGNTVAINLRAARAHGRIPLIYAGELVEVQGTLTAGRAMTAAAVMRAKSAPAAWSPDIR